MVLRPSSRPTGMWLVFLFLLGLPAFCFAQQITYEYDALGRLTVVTTPEGVARYEYDAVGNILRITTRRNSDVSGPVAILLLDPNRGAPGTVVQIYGRGFASSPADNQLAFNGAAAVVTAATATSLVTTVPAGATTGPVTLTTPLGTALSADVFSVLKTFTVSPAEAEVVPGESFPFQALLDGVATPDVTWQVNGVPGGNASLGTITTAGVYRAPQVQGQQTVTVQALLTTDRTQVATATVRLGLPSLLTTVPVAVAVTKPPLTGNVLATAAPASVAVTRSLPTGNVMVASAPASISAGPVVSGVTPGTGRVGTVVGLTLAGQNLQGTTAIRFLRSGSLDATLAAASIVPSGDGTSVTCSVIISSSAPQGMRVVEVVTPQGTSCGIDFGVNRFTVTP